MDRDSLLIGTDGRRIADLTLQRGLRINILAGSLGAAWFGLTQGMPLTMFLEALGSSGLVMGLATTMMQLAFAVQLPGALIAGRLRARKVFWGAIIMASRLLWFLPFLFLVYLTDKPLVIARGMIWLTAFSAILAQFVTAFWFSWMADLVPERMSGRFWGMRQTWTMISFVVAMAAAGWILDTFPMPGAHGGSWAGFSLVFTIGAVLGVIDIIIHMWVPEPRVRLPDGSQNLFDRVMEPLRSPDFRKLTIAMSIYALSCGFTSLGIVFLKKDFPITYSHLSALTIASCMGTMIFGIMWGYVMDRVGGRAFGAVMLLIAPFIAVGWFFVKGYEVDFVTLTAGIPLLGKAVKAFIELLPLAWQQWIPMQTLPQAVWILLFTWFLSGAVYGGIGLAQLNLASLLASKQNRTVAMAIHWTLVGLVGSTGAIVAGKVMDYFAAHPVAYTFPSGTKLAFHHALVMLHMFLLWFVVLPIVLRIRRGKGEPHIIGAFSQLLITSPFRVVTNIYVMGAAVTGRRRALAARTLGDRRSTIAVRDLIEGLDDPSAEVREESAYALGSIGSPEAVAALVAKLEDPNCDLGPQCARALRMARAQASVSALLRKLNDSDRETRSECAKALGEIGDFRALQPLRALLAKSTDTKVTCSVSEALAHLGDLVSLPDIAAVMRLSRNRVVRLSLAMCVGDMLGERDEFYKIFTREQQTRGGEVADMVKNLNNDIRHARRIGAVAAAPLIEKVKKLRVSYEEDRFDTCADLMFEIITDLAEFRWSVKPGADPRAFLDDLKDRDRHFGAGAGYLHALRDQAEALDNVDVLLGIYFISVRGLPR